MGWVTDRIRRDFTTIWVGGLIGIWLGLVVWVGVYRPEAAVRAAVRAPEGKTELRHDPNAACAGCHREIYERYRNTPMARASGVAADGFMPASFAHEASGVAYRIERRTVPGNSVWLTFERADVPGGGDSRALRGERELRYFLGSGTRGRTYLFEDSGYWFEIPINWYAKKRVWDMAPNFLTATEMPLMLPVDPGCLRCHSSGAQASLPEARNKYAGAPFLEGGINCVACHEGKTGEAAAHVASGGKTALMKIGELAPVKRDSVCLGCHLEGEQAVVHRGKRLVDFRPGESLFDYASYFVASGSGTGSGGGVRATSQWEALLRSGCKRGAGDALTCTSCHDPHSSTVGMGAAERVQFYRGKCLSCHDADVAARSTAPVSTAARKGFAGSHHLENPDCAACHMPRAKADDIAHEQVTDHAIPRISRAVEGKAVKGESVAGRLVAIASSVGVAGVGSDRDLGLAYAFAASRGDRASGELAVSLLKKAEGHAGSATDSDLHEHLGFLEQLSGDKDVAAREYGLALEADEHDGVAAGDLALLKAQDRKYGEAIGLWERAFGDDPVQVKAGMNLALVECGVGRKEAALGVLDRILHFSPDDGAARELARGIRSGSHVCGVKPGR